MEYGFYEETVNGVLLIKNVLETLRSLFLFSSKVFLVLSLCGGEEEISPGRQVKVVQWKEESPKSQGPWILGCHTG